jgi:Rha family phage regulatory protein
MTTKNTNNKDNNLVIKLEIQNNEVLTTSNQVADVFGKDHAKVLRAIETIDCSEDFHKANFGESFREQKTGNGAIRKFKEYNITKDGFTFLAMGFTGKKAAGFKEAYIKEFNRMANTLNNQQTTPTTLAINKRKFLKIEEHNNECYFLTSEFANMFDIDHDKLMDKVSVFANTYKNNYSTKYLPHELIVFTARNKKQQAMIHHSVFLLFANQDLAYQSMIIDCITTIDEFYQKQTNKLLDEIIKLKNEFNRASYYVGHSVDIINNNLEPAIYFDDNLITTCLKLLKDMKAGLDNDDPDLALVSSCEALVETIIAQNKLQTMQLKNMIEQIQHNIGRSEIEVIKLYNGNAVGWMNTEHNTE